jgi:hypothetical protein
MVVIIVRRRSTIAAKERVLFLTGAHSSPISVDSKYFLSANPCVSRVVGGSMDG